MADLIDRQEAIVFINAGHLVNPNEPRWSDNEVVNLLKSRPSADAVEIVRCRDCKHRYIDGENVRYNVCDLNHNKVQGDDWYCADGERKDG